VWRSKSINENDNQIPLAAAVSRNPPPRACLRRTPVPLLPQAKLYSPDISRLTTSLRQTDRVPPRHNLPAPSLDRTLHLGLVSPNWSMADSIYIEFCAAHSSNCLSASFGYLHKSFPFPSQKVLLGSLCCSPKRHCITLQIFHRILINAFSFTIHHIVSMMPSTPQHE
jgi:hypothetical protein